jgi:hypothetical protein
MAMSNTHRFYLIFVFFVLAAGLMLTAACSDDGATPVDANGNGSPEDSVRVVLLTWDDLAGSGPNSDTPGTVTEIQFSISAPHMQTIDRTVQPSASPVESKFDVPPGETIRFEAKAYNGASDHLFTGVTFSDVFDGSEAVGLYMISVDDDQPPTFSGVSSSEAISDTDLELSWQPASDASGPRNVITYLVYTASSSGGQDYTHPMQVTEPGQTSVLLTDLDAGTTYYVVIRAMDQSGNVDANVVEQSASTYSAQTVLYVDVNTGADTPDCGGETNPCRTITSALVKSSNDQTIRVARGTYDKTTGESFPLILKPGTRLIGEGDWIFGRFFPKTIAAADTTPIVEGDTGAWVAGFYIDSNVGNWSAPTIEGWDKPLTVYRCTIDGDDNPTGVGVKLGRDSRVQYTRIHGYLSGRGVWAWGENTVIANNKVYDNQQGIAANGDNLYIAGNSITSNAVGIAGFAAKDMMIYNNHIAENDGDGLALQDLTGAQIIRNIIDKNGQSGLILYGNAAVDSAYVILNDIIRNSSYGMSIRTGRAGLYNNNFACNHTGLYVGTAEQIDARWCSWDHSPPTTSYGRGTEPGCEGEYDICYDGIYAGTPEPLHEPSSVGGCSIAIIPGPHLSQKGP